MNLLDQFREPVLYRRATIAGVQPDTRTIELFAVPYDTEAELVPGQLFESFAPKAFARAAKDPARCTLYDKHSDVGGNAIGRASEVHDEEKGVRVVAHVSNTRAGDDALTLAKDGVLAEASIEFRAHPDDMVISRRPDGATSVRHKRAHLLGVALVPHGAYGRSAPVLSVRSDEAEKQREAILARLRGRTA